jgi:hypothetical protein
VSLGSTLETIPSVRDRLSAVNGQEIEHSYCPMILAGRAAERKAAPSGVWSEWLRE